MQIEKYLKEYQPIVYRTFVNALNNNHLSHAYLITGNKGTPLLQVAKFLAKSILCDKPNPLACSSCISCIRIEDNNYPDLMIFDGEEKSISKSNVKEIEDRFASKALDNKGIKIYILNCIEYMGDEATNAILKFLEEPQDNIYAFLTTNNENIILPTILSRCQKLHLKSLERNVVIEEAIEYGVKDVDAQLLSYFYNNAELISDILDDKTLSEAYSKCKKALDILLDALSNDSPKYALFIAETQILPLVNKKETFRFFLDLLITVYEDLLNCKNDRKIYLSYYAKILFDLANNKLLHLDETLLELLKQRNLIGLNLNIPLQLDHIILQIIKR